MEKDIKTVVGALGVAAATEDSTEEDFKSTIRYNVEQMETYLGKVERGDDFTGDLQHHLDSMKAAFQGLEEIESEKRHQREAEEEREQMVDDIIRYSDGQRKREDIENLSEDELWNLYEEEQAKWLEAE